LIHKGFECAEITYKVIQNNRKPHSSTENNKLLLTVNSNYHFPDVSNCLIIRSWATSNDLVIKLHNLQALLEVTPSKFL